MPAQPAVSGPGQSPPKALDRAAGARSQHSAKPPGSKRPGSSHTSLTAGAVFAAVLAVAITVAWPWLSQRVLTPSVLRPLKAPKLTALPQFTPQYQHDMLWGSYRAGLYFGMRTRSPLSLLTGLMWFDPDAVDTLSHGRVRHAASQDDHLARYGWVRHDGRRWGRQVLVDRHYNITLTLVKSTTHAASGPGGDWAVRVNVTRAHPAPPLDPEAPRAPRRVSLVWYITDEAKPSAPWEVMPAGESDSVGGGGDQSTDPTLLVTGGNAVIGPWSLHAVDASTPRGAPTSGSKPPRPPRLQHLSLVAREDEGVDYRLQIKEVVMSIMYEHLQRNPQSNRFHLVLPNGQTTGADLALFQITLPIGGCVDLVFLSHARTGRPGSSSAPPTPPSSPALARMYAPAAHTVLGDVRVRQLSGQQLSHAIQTLEQEFDARFDTVFPPPAPDTTSAADDAGATPAPSPAEQSTSAAREVAKAALSNLLGSAGYFYGSSQVRVPGSAPSSPAGSYWPAPLFTCTPSRSFFPRGFLWDEGFHQLLVQRWDPLVSRDMLAHWLDLLNVHGWIPREQILGAEARQRVPAEFVTQDPAHANPPSLFLPVVRMAQVLKACSGGASSSGPACADVAGGGADVAGVRDFLHAAWPRLSAWYRWFNTTQTGAVPGSYRWRGRNTTTTSELNPKTLTSGLDDYPRASHPSADERHVDLLAWMALASGAMADIGTALGLPPEVTAPYTVAHARLTDPGHLNGLHWDKSARQYRDWGWHSEDVRLMRRQEVVDGQWQETSVRAVGTPPTLGFVPHYGYVSLFPVLLRLLPPDSTQLGAVLTQLKDSARGLWTPYGLRSLAVQSSLYKQYNTAHDPPYWRGQIWCNINYLALWALQHYAATPGPHAPTAAQLLQELQAGLTQNLVRQYTSRGYLYEQYDDVSGAGTSSHPFTGWTALVALIATGTY